MEPNPHQIAFQKLTEEAWDYEMSFNPFYATLVGDYRFNDRLPHVAPQDWQDHLKTLKVFQERLALINRAALSETEQLNFDIFSRLLANDIHEDVFGAYYLPISKTAGFHLDFPELFQFVPLQSLKDYQDYLSRLGGFKHYVEEHIALMSEGLQRGYRPVRVTLEGIQPSIEAQVVPQPEANPLFTPFANFPDFLHPGEQDNLRQAGRAAIQDSVVPGFKLLLDFIEQQYLPAARQEPGISALPDGAQFYRHRVRMFTSLDIEPEEVHQTGLDEVRRIRQEMLEIVSQHLPPEYHGRDDFAAFLQFLRSDSRFYASTPEALLAHTALILKRMDGELPRLFKTLPRMPYGIRPIPEHSAPGNTTAYYFPPAGDGSRAGFYYVNTYDLPSRPLYEIEALSLHEAVPGHHLQIALQQELGELPKFRRFGGFTAFVEGWALYAERLGLEVGFYQDPFSNFGRLSYEMWRACRLVVDTGIHAFGWTRQQAIDFMSENTSLSPLNIANEVDRYIFWPGQALAYKIGELKIRHLRELAQARLGESFDLRAFHEVLLGQGALPLDILENLLKRWIAQNENLEQGASR